MHPGERTKRANTMRTDSEKTPVDQAADLFVYAPIGLFFEAPSLLPKLAEQGRVHARNARLFGQFAVRQGEAEVRRRLAALEGQTNGLLRALGLVPESDGEGDAGDEHATAPSTPSPRRAAATDLDAAPSEPSPAVVDLAITDYDSLSASQVVTRLAGLSHRELESVRAYEAAHRGRKTILNKVAQLQA
jgi:hypothetical protein